MGIQQTISTAIPDVTLKAPIEGLVVPIEAVPDPVFAQKMVGDGLAIDPTSDILVAPFDGTVSQIQKTGHAITLKHASGLEILMHIGIDTVLLKGEGFRSLVSDGDQVKAGQPLIQVDLDTVAQKAKSLVTVVVITNGDEFGCSLRKAEENTVLTAANDLLTISLNANGADRATQTGEWQQSMPITIPNSAGFHARPAAALVKIAKEYKADIELSCNGLKGNAKSVTGLLQLNVQLNDQVVVLARGEDASEAISELIPAIRAGLGDKVEEVTERLAATEEQPVEASLLFTANTNENELKGISASPGIAFGVVHQIRTEVLEYDEFAEDISEELVSLDMAVYQARREVQQLHDKLEQQNEAQKAKIFAAHNELLSDPEIYQQAVELVREGKSAAFAWNSAYSGQADLLASLDNALLKERASDIRDIGLRVLRHILGVSHSLGNLPENAILIAEDLTPSDTANLDATKVAAFCTVKGGATSHSAILARSMGIPALAGIEKRATDIADGSAALLNSEEGMLYLSPTAEQVTAQQAKHTAQLKTRELNRLDADKPATTTDGTAIHVAGNIGSVADAAAVKANHGDGVGLLRSEFIFMNRTSAPSEQEQYEVYRAAAESLKENQPLIVRTLDVGGDKPLPYIDLPEEENPFLGERGIRIGLDRPALLRQQLRALLRAAEHGNIHVMFPMISDLHELKLAKQVLEEERTKLNAKAIPVGIMIEVPSAAVMADVLAPEVDFFSVGTNDLTQYTLAMDRGHPKLASLADALHPSVLRMIKLTTDAAAKHGKWVGVCGGLASEPLAVPVLVGLGVTELSVNIPAIADVKAAVRSLELTTCKSVASKALRLSSAGEVRALLQASQS
ncbi:phosphoenolpyruvate--protein phosphotransferase [Reinekea marinisedimentorum]|uniref:phosphoenolpyruvate--protein phosphotransferase n=1 Tax=Reinekea marinisedimentorum TaxID=230495 RepID=A0A4R3HRD5_9GAMM|nr:phosphoenolpyruvate--protein phosphotransferase [Reinekea marinisedimentorum]TCS35676.1 phosphocarrier protein FPr [Reinekea marinisedimentorum]